SHRSENFCNNNECERWCVDYDPLAWTGFCFKSKNEDYCLCDFVTDCVEINNATCEESCKRYPTFELVKYCAVPEKGVDCACVYDVDESLLDHKSEIHSPKRETHPWGECGWRSVWKNQGGEERGPVSKAGGGISGDRNDR
ncbi:hypothetical protein AVEN_28249-1, partial [Araneus ventricosus]